MNYWLQRLGMAVLLLLAVSMLTFGAMSLLGDPLANILGPRVGDTSPEGLALIEEAKAEFHLDDPLPVRYVKWLGDFVTGDFGVQFGSDGQPPVSDLIKERLPRSLTLVVIKMARVISDLIDMRRHAFRETVILLQINRQIGLGLSPDFGQGLGVLSAVDRNTDHVRARVIQQIHQFHGRVDIGCAGGRHRLNRDFVSRTDRHRPDSNRPGPVSLNFNHGLTVLDSVYE